MLGTLVGPGIQHDKRGKTALPDSETLTGMVNLANALKLKEGKGKGISFHVALCTVDDDGPAKVSAYNDFVNEKKGAAVCYEDVVMPVALGPGHILVHQSVAPCTRCRSGYKNWARQRRCTIVVSADEGYDQSGDNKVFIFAPTGLVFFG